MKDIINFYERTVTLLASQFQGSAAGGGKTNFQKMLAALVAPCYDINTVELQLYQERWLATAVGVQLDRLGEIIGLARLPDQSDADYREALYFQVQINQSTGTPEEAIFALKFLTKATKVQYLEPYPAFYQMFTDGLPANFTIPPQDVVVAISNMSPAGVQYVPITWHYNEALVFGFSSDPIVEDFYVAPDPDDLSAVNPFHVSTDGIDDLQFAINRGQTEDNPEVGGFGEDDFEVSGAGELAEVLILNGDVAPPL
jgi:hypothetical protein